MRLLDAALATDRAVVVPIKIDAAGLRSTGVVPALFRDLISTPARRSTGNGRAGVPVLRERLAGLPQAEQLDLILDTVRTRIAGILGHDTPRSVDADRGLMEMGFDSLTAVELRNGLSALTDLRLPSTFVFDYPTPSAMARQLHAQLGLADEAMDEFDRFDEATIRRALASVPLERLREAGLIEPLMRLGRSGPPPGSQVSPADQTDTIKEADTDELIRMALSQNGSHG